jgi:hypothetical protein
MWGGNGPVFNPKAFEKWAEAFLTTYAMAVLEAKLAQPDLDELA